MGLLHQFFKLRATNTQVYCLFTSIYKGPIPLMLYLVLLRSVGWGMNSGPLLGYLSFNKYMEIAFLVQTFLFHSILKSIRVESF